MVIADGPANLAESTRALLLAADFAIVPCGVTVPELESTTETIRMLHNARVVRGGGCPGACTVLTRVRNDRFVLTREAHDAAAALGLPVCRFVLRLREATADAPGQRTTVWNMGSKAKLAAAEMRDLMKELDEHARQEAIDDRGALRRATGVSTERLSASICTSP